MLDNLRYSKVPGADWHLAIVLLAFFVQAYILLAAHGFVLALIVALAGLFIAWWKVE